jgi:hypothetical protein
MRVRAAYAQARKALSSTSPFNHRCPNWISWNEQAGRFLLIPERCEVLRRMSLDGYGTPTIAKTLIAGAGCTLVYLPPYSPDFNPIESMWSKVKASLRKAAARTFDTIVDAVREALLTVTPDDCDGYFRHCGYDARPN